MYSKPQLIQGVHSFSGKGLTNPHVLASEMTYTVPVGKRTQFVYFRGGNSAAEMVYAVLMRDGNPMRYFPIGAKSDTHVALAVVEDLMSGTKLEVHVAAPEGVSGVLVLDIGLVEI
jgi:assimilatory nitrate reductase catalytic subunit